MNERQRAVPLTALTRALCLVVTVLMLAAIVYVGITAFEYYGHIGV